MPAIHIPEDTWAKLLMECDGDRKEAREKVKEGAASMIDEKPP